MAQLCRSTWGDTRFLVREGQRSAALATCLARMYSKPDRVKERPAALRKSSGAGALPRIASHARKVATVSLHIGICLSRRPLPRTRMCVVG